MTLEQKLELVVGFFLPTLCMVSFASFAFAATRFVFRLYIGCPSFDMTCAIALSHQQHFQTGNSNEKYRAQWKGELRRAVGTICRKHVLFHAVA